MCIFNHVYGKVDEKGFQYCTKCGKARRVPCQHKWEEKDEYSLSDSCGKQKGAIIVSLCVHCGELKNHSVKSNY